MRRALLGLSVVLAVVAFAGCGGDDGDGKASPKQVYAQQLADAGKPLQEAFSDADQGGANVSSADIIGQLEEQAVTVEDTVKKMQAITPPAGLAATHRKLIDGLRELSRSFRKGAEAAQRKDTKSLTTALQALPKSTGVKKLTEASAELKKQGVTVTTAAK